jgi:hypothetical protein
MKLDDLFSDDYMALAATGNLRQIAAVNPANLQMAQKHLQSAIASLEGEIQTSATTIANISAMKAYLGVVTELLSQMGLVSNDNDQASVLAYL